MAELKGGTYVNQRRAVQAIEMNEDERASEEQGGTRLYLRGSDRLNDHGWPSPRIGGGNY